MAGRLELAAVSIVSLSIGTAGVAPARAAAAHPQPAPAEASRHVAELDRAFETSLARAGDRPGRITVELALLADIERSGLAPEDCRQALSLLTFRPLTPAERSAVQILSDKIGSLLQGRPTDGVSLRGPVAPDTASVIVAGGPPPPSSADTPDYRPGH
jgi:hypothetical protein